MQGSVESGRLEDSWTPWMDAARHSRRAVPGRIIMIMIIMMIMIRHELVMWRIGNDDGFDVVKFHIKPSTVRVICDIYI